MSIWFMLFKYGGELMILHVCLKCLLLDMLMKQERTQNTGGTRSIYIQTQYKNLEFLVQTNLFKTISNYY